LNSAGAGGKTLRMSDDKDKNLSRIQTKEERLAGKLRENLRRRKAQSRQMGGEMRDSQEADLPKRGSDS
jgi:hypothetical protein